jgi:hypothetical protein
LREKRINAVVASWLPVLCFLYLLNSDTGWLTAGSPRQKEEAEDEPKPRSVFSFSVDYPSKFGKRHFVDTEMFSLNT